MLAHRPGTNAQIRTCPTSPFLTQHLGSLLDTHLRDKRWMKPFVMPEAMDVGKLAYIMNRLQLLVPSGFTFDFSLESGNMTQLIELNPFGALSVCRKYLFNWIKNARLLYGLEDGFVFFMVLV
ncbi:uncharacterized protein BDR25DRAFT_313555 [Lindgomyces ingoldianus]|uniref:Uncharacterized protein n=1 Tax=Lindgomyces ingoldianus TaxID=673940 RepID=A0ACB6QZJ7_9PLEO|nr:uncharacterized protein BDR25DRAFT_313555 [Lindgomyces ingoldianus]KAF2471621.1 hypothetical protein BDR25DRAFT_313555 [Lindgomyces ingoldianus]